jgi:hypothetical protein
MCEPDWRRHLQHVAPSRRVLFGLQLFPEASIDYWIDNLDLVANEALVVEAAQAYAGSGYLVLVKDHPLQFGFRRTQLLEQLRAIPNVVIVPYEVGGNELLDLCAVNFTCTGTLGLQAALLGKVAVGTDSYYTNDDDFVIFRKRSEIPGLPARSESRDLDLTRAFNEHHVHRVRLDRGIRVHAPEQARGRAFVAGLFTQFAHAGDNRILAALNHAAGDLEEEVVPPKAELPHQNHLVLRRQGDHVHPVVGVDDDEFALAILESVSEARAPHLKDAVVFDRVVDEPFPCARRWRRVRGRGVFQ